ncbi:MAG: hypothetical protein ACRDHW_14520 [Ktedonobacteraceae bacterium]
MMTQAIVPTMGVSVERYGPGETAPNPQPGDFILTHGNAWFNKFIRVGQGLRFRGKDRKYAYWDHAAIVVDEHGELIEAAGPGVRRTDLSQYQDIEYHLVCLGTAVNATDRAEAVAFAEWSLGGPYGWLTIVCVAVGLLTGGGFTFGFEGQQICSGLVARAMERTSAIFDRNPEDIMPADLAKYYHVDLTK